MGYRVYRLEVKSEEARAKLEGFLGSLKGEVISVIPMTKKLSLFQIYGISSRLESFLVVEKE